MSVGNVEALYPAAVNVFHQSDELTTAWLKNVKLNKQDAMV